MSMNVNPNAPTGSVDPNLPTEDVKNNDQQNKQKDMSGVSDTGGGAKQTFGRPTLTPPTISAAAMMIALTALNSKITEENVKLGEGTVESLQKDIKDQAVKRAEQLKKHLENLDKINSRKKCGLIGALVTFFKKIAAGDVGGAFKTLGENIGNILKDVLQVVAVIVALAAAVALTAVSGGAGAATIAVVVVAAVLVIGSMAMADPVVMEAMINSLPEDQRQAAGIALAVVAAVLALTGGIMMSAATGGASAFATVSTVLSILTSATETGVTIQQGVDGYQQSGYKSESLIQQSEMDKTDALMTDIKGTIDRNQKDLKSLFESFSKLIESTRQMVQTSGQNLSRAASV